MLPNQRIVTFRAPAHRIRALFEQMGALIGQRRFEGWERPELECLQQALREACYADNAATVAIEHSHAGEAAALLSHAAWQFNLQHTVIEPETEEATSEEAGTAYTAVLLYPDYATGDYGADIKVLSARAGDPAEAAALCQRQAMEETNADSDVHIEGPTDFRCIAVFEGELQTVLDAPDFQKDIVELARENRKKDPSRGPAP